jgi:hypothetical protein
MTKDNFGKEKGLHGMVCARALREKPLVERVPDCLFLK